MDRLFHPSAHPAGAGRTIGSARRYEWLTGVLFAGGRKPALQRLVAAAEVRRGHQVLDVGCGDGMLTTLAAAAAGPGGAAVGIDAAPEMVEHARRRHPTATFEVGSATAIASPDAHFDAVLCCLVLHHLEPPAQAVAVAEMARVLKPGGRLLVAEFTVPDAGPWRMLAHLLGLEGMGKAAPALEGVLSVARLTGLATGEVPPWLRYASGRRPAPSD